MHPRKEIYAQEVYHLVGMICKQMSEPTKAAIPTVLNITNNDAQIIINKIMIALPDCYFYNANAAKLYDMLAFISKNLILFQAQEHFEEEDYAYNLINFISSLSQSIAKRYYS